VISEVLAGAKARFAVLVRRHNQPVFRACRAVLRDDQEAEDAVQTAWLAAYRALSTFRREASFRTWVTRIAVNEAASRLRNQRRLTAVEPADLTGDMTMTDHVNPEQAVATRELGRLLEQEIDALPEGLRSVLVLRDVVELDTGETAECLGIADENVRVRLHRARQTLAQRLGPAMQPLMETALPDVWRFDGDRCARMMDAVMAAILKL
jgi:RNA polymerase sigma-70 factor (ECF subfamily)